MVGFGAWAARLFLGPRNPAPHRPKSRLLKSRPGATRLFSNTDFICPGTTCRLHARSHVAAFGSLASVRPVSARSASAVCCGMKGFNIFLGKIRPHTIAASCASVHECHVQASHAKPPRMALPPRAFVTPLPRRSSGLQILVVGDPSV